MIENQTEKKIKTLRTDNGTEYESNEFHDFCKEVGIKRKTITPYTLEQNGVVERKNRTIVEAIRAKLHDQRLPKFLWADAASTVVYVQTDALIKHWVPRLLKKFSPVRTLTYHILEFLKALYIFMCQKRKGINWVHMERKESSWAMVQILRAKEST